MIGRRAIGLILGAAVLVAACSALPRSRPSNPSAPAPDTSSSARRAEVSVKFEPKLFYPAVEKYPAGVAGEAGVSYAGGIISHHELADELIAEFFAKLSLGKAIRTFVIVGPNHANVGLSPVISGRVRWTTALGAVDTDEELLDELILSGLVTSDEEHLTQDHAVKTLVPFIRRYFPEAKVVPLLITSEETEHKDALLVQQLRNLSRDDTFILASLDFSHYLPAEEAGLKDEETIASIGRKDYETISRWGNDHVDSPWALITLLKAMEREGAEGPELVRHLNSADLPGGDRGNTTSYFSLVYIR